MGSRRTSKSFQVWRAAVLVLANIIFLNRAPDLFPCAITPRVSHMDIHELSMADLVES